MPVRPAVRYFDSRKAYYCQINRVQHLLAKGPDDFPNGPNYLAALAAFTRLSCASNVDKAKDGNPLEPVLTRYLFEQERSKGPKRTRGTKHLIDSAIDALGGVKVADLVPAMVFDWIGAKRDQRGTDGKGRLVGWSEGTCRTAWDRIQAALNWARGAGIITRNPLSGSKCPYQARARGAEAVLPPRLRSLLIAGAPAGFDVALRVLEATGARPAEVFRAEAFNLSAGRLVYSWNTSRGYVWKNARKTQKDRVIYLPPSVRADVEQLAQLHPTGRLFRSETTGKAWGDASINPTFQKIRRKKPVQEWLAANRRKAQSVTLYGFRHTFITDWLLAGLSIHACAEMCGTSVSMIEQHYSHLAADNAAMERLAVNFEGMRCR